MKQIKQVIDEIGISKVRLAKYMGVSRQMLYNYLSMKDMESWPGDKASKLFLLLGVKNEDELLKKRITPDYIVDVETRLNEGIKDVKDVESIGDLVGFNRKEQSVLTDLIVLLKEKLKDDDSKETLYAYKYLYHFLQSMETAPELKYILAYMSKAMGFTDPLEFVFDENGQFIFESILFSGMTLYHNGGASKSKLAESHKRFVQDIEQKNEEKLSRTQELNTAKVQALKELGYTEINEDNAKEVLEKIAEIQSRKV